MENNIYAQVAIQKNSKVNQDGIFYTIDEHAKLVSKIKGMNQKCEIEKEYLTKKLQLQHNLDMSRLKIDNESLSKQLKLSEQLYKDNKKYLLKELEISKTVKWYKHPSFVFTVGVITTSLVYGLLTYGYTKLK